MNAWFYRWLETHAPAATFVIRLLAGLVFLLEGVKKFLFPTEWGVGRFEKIGIWHPALSAPFVGAVETVCESRRVRKLFSVPQPLLAAFVPRAIAAPSTRALPQSASSGSSSMSAQLALMGSLSAVAVVPR